MDKFFDHSRYSKEEAESEAEKMKQLAGEDATPADYKTANELIEDEKLTTKEWIESAWKKGRITIIPPESDKNTMIALNTKNPKIFELFNRAANKVTKKYNGFHQVGSNDKTGYTAWELWSLRGEHPSHVVDEIYQEMLELEKIFYPDSN